MDSEPTRPLMSPSRLQKIDQLREKNIGTYLPLPQLVAVGDRSSGKSSLLETLTGIPLPCGPEFCTRYVTQITHRREDHPRIDISIIPGPDATPSERVLLESYHRQVRTNAELCAEFPAILDDVNALMNIRITTNLAGEKTFSEDILKIEKCGPDEDYLSVIDVPGIFHITTEGITTYEDKALVKAMVQSYIKDSQSIILAVLPSNIDVTTQEILSLAEEFDKTGERTLGILTKPDLLNEHNAKLAVCSLVEGRRKPLKLGYHVVRNRGQDGDDDGDSQAREAMFRSLPWSGLPEERVGISALRERLEELLGQITDQGFAQLRAETRQVLEATENELNELGLPRQTEREQQLYLVDMAGKFQSLVRAALEADYSAHPAFERNELRLITAVVNITDRFHTDFDDLSHTYLFESEAAIHLDTPLGVNTPEPYWIDESDDVMITDAPDFDVPEPEAFPDLDKVIVKDSRIELPKTGILNWIESVHRSSRGLELAMFSQGILSSIFREQSAKWGTMAKQYLSKIILVVHRFILKTLEIVCTDAQVREELVSVILRDLLAKYEAGMKRAAFLVDVERDLKPYTLNNYFSHIHQRNYGVRLRQAMAPHARMQDDNQWKGLVIDLNSVKFAATTKSNATITRESIHDILEAYYKVAYKRFVDNIFKQAVDYELLSGPASPLRVFSEQWVLQIDTDNLFAIAGESRRIKDRRERLKKKAQILEEAMWILR